MSREAEDWSDLTFASLATDDAKQSRDLAAGGMIRLGGDIRGIKEDMFVIQDDLRSKRYGENEIGELRAYVEALRYKQKGKNDKFEKLFGKFQRLFEVILRHGTPELLAHVNAAMADWQAEEARYTEEDVKRAREYAKTKSRMNYPDGDDDAL
ncbi:hypothetical protein VTK26DRAFT_7562 [Humicola hyalothermophila]